MSWFQPLLGIIQDLDRAVDHVAELIQEHIAPPVEDTATAIDTFLQERGPELRDRTSEALEVLDERWQHFIVKRVDPLFGESRTAHLDEMGNLEISPYETVLNRRIGYTAIAFVALAIGGTIWPASLFLSVPLSFTMMLPAYEMAVQSVKKHGRITYHVVSALNVTGIWLGGYYTPAMAATLFFFAGEKLLLITQDRSQKRLISVFAAQPNSVWLLRDGVEIELPFEAVEVGDIVVVNAGGHVPVDGTVVDGIASIDQHMLTGEAQPVERAAGDTVYASTVVLAGSVQVRVDKAGDETVAAKIGEVLNQTASYQLALQSRGSKAAHDAAVPTLAIAGVAMATVGGEGALATLNSAFGVPLRMSAPITMLNLLNIASQNAILLKDGRSLELLSEVDTVLFDKTGTLTIAQPHVTLIHTVGDADAEHVLTCAAAAEYRQTHPVAVAIVAAAVERKLPLPDINNARYEIGYGIRVELDGQTIEVGSDRFMERSGITVPEAIRESQAASHAQGHSLIMVAIDGQTVGAIELEPTIRPEVAEVLAALRERDLQLVVISGDQEEPTRRLAANLGIDRYFANVLPEGKAALVERLQAEGRASASSATGSTTRSRSRRRTSRSRSAARRRSRPMPRRWS